MTYHFHNLCEIIEMQPTRPIIGKIPMAMKFVDIKFQIFKWNKEKKKLEYICSSCPL